MAGQRGKRTIGLGTTHRRLRPRARVHTLVSKNTSPSSSASVALEAKKNGGGRPQALAQWRARISAAIVWERASQLFRRQRDASLAHLTPDEIAMHPRGHALLEAP